MTRDALAPYYLLTPFQLRAQTFRVNMELSTFYHVFFYQNNFDVEWPKWVSNGTLRTTSDPNLFKFQRIVQLMLLVLESLDTPRI